LVFFRKRSTFAKLFQNRVVMEVFRRKNDLKAFLADKKNIGFVPTMGALHEGHLSLIKRCASENEICVVSVFVNPTQFNDKNDLKNYPRTEDADLALLRANGCDAAFLPSVEEMYPEEDTRVFDFGEIGNVMEGPRRPGHFNGVSQVVSRLFDIVAPQKAYFGEKDFQQIAIIRSMVKQLNYDIEIVSCPIVREQSGLAKSSRNTLLTDGEKEKAVLISKTLFESVNFAKSKSVTDVKQWVIDTINAEQILDVEYFEIVDGYTLQSIENWNDADYVVGCITVYCGSRPVRLIDNITYKK